MFSALKIIYNLNVEAEIFSETLVHLYMTTKETEIFILWVGWSKWATHTERTVQDSKRKVGWNVRTVHG